MGELFANVKTMTQTTCALIAQLIGVFVFAPCTIVLLSKSEISSHGCTSGFCRTRRGRLSRDVATLSALRFPR